MVLQHLNSLATSHQKTSNNLQNVKRANELLAKFSTPKVAPAIELPTKR